MTVRFEWRRRVFAALSALALCTAIVISAVAISSPADATGLAGTYRLVNSNTRVTFSSLTPMFFQPNATTDGAPLAPPALTAAQAFARFSDGKAIRHEVSYQYGTLTEIHDPPLGGFGIGRPIRDRPVWAFSLTVSGCRPDADRSSLAPIPKEYPSICTAYEFVDPNTGRLLAGTFTSVL